MNITTPSTPPAIGPRAARALLRIVLDAERQREQAEEAKAS